MKYYVHDTKYKYKYYFDTETGFYMRTGILDDDGHDTGIDPFMSSFPHLIDVGIMGHCIHGESGLCRNAGVQCYQSGSKVKKENMTSENFRKIAEECRNRTNQIALGGRGDPNHHEEFEKILQICHSNNLVPNYTTSGYKMTDEQIKLTKKYCGAVAVSWYRSSYTHEAVNRLIDAGCRTNIHYVLSKNTIEEAVERLSGKGFISGINAVIFLMHKPVGQGTVSNMISAEDPLLKEFCQIVNEKNHSYKIGFDSCSVPMLLNYCPSLLRQSLDTCEGGRYSCYISSDMIMTTCSFDQSEQFGVPLNGKSISDVWNSERFEAFRNSLRRSCPDCNERDFCMGGCPIIPDIALCIRKEKNQIYGGKS